MKLEFESNAVSSPLVGNHVPAEFEEHNNSPEVLEILRHGIKSAQDGDRAEARNLLLSVTEADPQNENAWLWLASISEYPEELLVFLNNVLQINPENERALEWAKATKSLIAKTFVQRGIDAAKDEQKKFAKQYFLQAIVHDRDSELAYLWLASVSDSSEEKMSHLHKVLSINPDNENAASSLKNAKENKAKALLPKANTAAISGKRDVALNLLEEIFTDAPDFEDAWMLKAHISESFDDKIEAFERVLEINPENPVARANVDSLKMFAENSEAESSVPMPADDFEDSHQLFGPTETFRAPAQEETAQEESVSEMEASKEEGASDFEEFEAKEEGASDFEEFEAKEEGASDFEEFEAKDEGSDPVEFHEEEAVPYEDVAPELEAEGESPVHEESMFEGDNLFSFEDAKESAEVDEDAASLEMEASEENQADEAPLEFGDESFEEETESVDHDYVEESIDFSANEDSDEAESMEAADETVELAAEDEQHSDESPVVEEEVSELDAASEDHQDQTMEALEESESVEEEEEAEEFAEFSAEADENEGFETEASGEPEMPSFESTESLSQELPTENASKYTVCAYCLEENENQAFACHRCKAIFTISDIEMIVSHQKADKEIISKALEKMEVEKSLRGVDVQDLKHLGIGYLNLKDYRKGFEYLQKASKKDPNDVVLISQIDALAVRLAEIEDHERDSEPMTASKKILVVDDSPTVRKLISGKLEKCGHEPICAVDGMDALAKINEEIPDLILLDITMPRMDGYQVCKLIRSNEATKDVPVVMISGKDGFFDKVRGRMAGTSNYITKPFGPETLMKTVNEYIQ